MKIKRSDIRPTKMSTNPLQCITDAGDRVISNNKVYQYVGIGWVEERKAEKEDYKNIPEIID